MVFSVDIGSFQYCCELHGLRTHNSPISPSAHSQPSSSTRRTSQFGMTFPVLPLRSSPDRLAMKMSRHYVDPMPPRILRPTQSFHRSNSTRLSCSPAEI